MWGRKDKLKIKAISLRKRGLSYNEIRLKIPVAKSTLSLWLNSVKLKPEYKNRLYTKQIKSLSLGASSQKERRAREVEIIVETARKEVGLPLDPEVLKMMGAALYWAEGSKTKNFTITNSDPHLILFFVKWLEGVFEIEPKNLKAWLNIYPQQNELGIKKFWSSLTLIPIQNFGKSFVKPVSTGYKRNNLYYGTIKVFVPKGTDMRHRVFGWIKAALSDIDVNSKHSQKEWVSLTKTARPVNLIKNLL